MIRAGITGNIGSGKSLICTVFQKLGVSVFQADLAAHELYHESEVRKTIEYELGAGFYDVQGHLIRKNLSDRIFSDVKALKFIETLIHPIVRQRFNDWCQSHQNDPYVLYEAAILFETGNYKLFDKLIYVAADEQIRLKRVADRDNLPVEEIRKRMNKQWHDDQKIPLADFVIFNSGESMIIPQVIEIHQKLISLSN